jgi:DNA polymerase-3 subunit gamma/tau
MDEANTSVTMGSGPAYRVLARKYRPTDFTQLVGQEPMVRTLTNAFESGRIAQAWMLTGVRGVGKTTTARILARALNYRTSEIDRPTITMTAEGEHCRAIMEGRHVDVIEMDAASHTGIDDIRDIIDRVRYAPASARYKVYIIDEVHMLSPQAFNGLLKTLEEPPPHVKFIFATTEIRKVPITVLSRCQRFDLRRIEAGVIRDDLKRIAGLESVEVEDEALAMIARAAEGSMRDAQSIFDQAIAHGSGTVVASAVRDMLGVADRTRVISLFESVMRGDAAAALIEYRAQYDTGADPAAVLTDLAEFTHLVTRLRFVPDAASDASLSESERRRGQEFAEALSVRVLSRAWQMLLKGIPEVQSSNRPVSAGEMVLIRLAHAADLPTLDEALRGLGGASASAPAQNVDRSASQPDGVAQSSVLPNRIATGAAQSASLQPAQAAAVPSIRPAETTPEPEISVRSINDIAALAEQHRDMAFKVLVKNHVRLVRIEPGKLEIGLTESAPKTLVNDLTARLKKWTGRQWFVALSREQGAPTLAEAENTKREHALTDARNDPDVAAVLARFPGARITDVRIADIDNVDSVDANNPPLDDETN